MLEFKNHLGFMKKYIIEFLAVFIGIIAAFGLEEWRENNNNEEETSKALQYIKMDLQRDTSYYNLRLKIIERNIEYLKLAEKGPDISSGEFKKLHKGLRSAVEYKVHEYGYQYLTNSITHPKVKNDTLLMMIGYYYSLSSPEGNYGRLNNDFWKLTTSTYTKLFNIFPQFFHPDSTISNNEIDKNKAQFFSDPFWLGRINLTKRENQDIILQIFHKNREFAESILKYIDTENK